MQVPTLLTTAQELKYNRGAFFKFKMAFFNCMRIVSRWLAPI